MVRENDNISCRECKEKFESLFKFCLHTDNCKDKGILERKARIRNKEVELDTEHANDEAISLVENKENSDACKQN